MCVCVRECACVYAYSCVSVCACVRERACLSVVRAGERGLVRTNL